MGIVAQHLVEQQLAAQIEAGTPGLVLAAQNPTGIAAAECQLVVQEFAEAEQTSAEVVQKFVGLVLVQNLVAQSVFDFVELRRFERSFQLVAEQVLVVVVAQLVEEGS